MLLIDPIHIEYFDNREIMIDTLIRLNDKFKSTYILQVCHNQSQLVL